MRRRKLLVFVAILTGFLLGPASPAGAETLGNLDGSLPCAFDVLVVQTLSGGASTAFATDGTITSWSVPGAPGQEARLAVVRPTGGDDFTVVAASATETLTTSGTNTFSVFIPVTAGDYFGVWREGGSLCGNLTIGASSVFLASATPPSTGDAITTVAFGGSSFALQVEFTDEPVGAGGSFGFDVEPTTLVAEQVTSSSALLRGQLIVHTPYRFEYGLTDSYGQTTREMPRFLGSGPATAVVRNLQPATTYHYRIVHRFGVGEDMTFTTRP